MSYELLFESVLRSVWSWPLDHPLRAPRCVLAADGPEDLVSPPPYAAYTAGLFWARDWVARGALPSEMTVERPLVALERKRAVLEAPESGELCSEVWLTVLDGACGFDRGCQVPETTEALTRRLVATTAELLRRVAATRVGLRTSDQALVVWVPALTGGVPPAGVEDLGRQGLLLDPSVPLEIQVTSFVEVNDARSTSVRLEVCGCLPRPVDYVEYERPAGLGEPRCETC